MSRSHKPRTENADADPFDAAYYRRFYEDQTTAVSDLAAVQRLCTFVLAYLDFLELRLRSVLDMGCGVGHWRTALRQARPRIRYSGIEWSQHLCERFGWTRGSVVDHAPGKTFDLVVCQGVLQYLDDRQAARAIANLARCCHGALYVEALTVGDWRHNCDRTVTDGEVNLRPANWYRQRLQRHFRAIGGGLFVRKTAPVTLFELEGMV
ncbi:MAG: class I SAM-dependent methyltransferase [Planctomycetes bacterium]|nr:class I SAM-dependent methyltransferase [Planctomycetota bacterium]